MVTVFRQIAHSIRIKTDGGVVGGKERLEKTWKLGLEFECVKPDVESRGGKKWKCW
jgi:hypothetical protein